MTGPHPPIRPALHAEFSKATAYEPVAAALVGFRAFLIGTDPDVPAEPLGAVTPVHALRGTAGPEGVLHGIHQSAYRWGPGANEAICFARPLGLPGPVTPHADVMPVDCGCGLWAYTGGDHVMSVQWPTVLGVVVGWGRMVVGPSGFRAQYARIVGLAFPDAGVPVVGDRLTLDTNAGRLADATEAMRRGLAVAAHGIGVQLGNVGRAMRHEPLLPVPKPAPPAPPVRAARAWEAVPEHLQQRVAELYPEVDVFGTVAELQTAYPLTDLTPYLTGDDDAEQ